MQNNNSSLEQTEPRYAGFGIRLLAYIIDNLIVGVILMIPNLFFLLFKILVGSNFFVNQILFQYTGKDILFYICRILYFVLMTYFTSATIGKHLLKLKVVSVNDSGKYSFIDILYRETIGRFLSKFILYAGYLLNIINKDKSTLHDMLADTRVIYKSTASIDNDTEAHL